MQSSSTLLIQVQNRSLVMSVFCKWQNFPKVLGLRFLWVNLSQVMNWRSKLCQCSLWRCLSSLLWKRGPFSILKTKNIYFKSSAKLWKNLSWLSIGQQRILLLSPCLQLVIARMRKIRILNWYGASGDIAWVKTWILKYCLHSFWFLVSLLVLLNILTLINFTITSKSC